MANQIITFGCRLNSYESEVIKNKLEGKGVDDFIIFNTCAVTKEAENKAKQSIRKFRRANPNKKIVVTGCSAQINPKQYEGLAEVDLVIGNEEKFKEESYNSLFQENTEKVLVNDIMAVKETALHLISGFENKARAFVQVQNGCNHRCTFCIIPFARGNSRSVPLPQIIQQIKLLVEQGYSEVVLTGVDITDYGLDLPTKTTLSQMLKRLFAAVPELPRLRLSSIDVAELDNDFFSLIKNEPRLMPHLHLSLQAGDDLILKRMKRRHNRNQVIEFCQKAKELRHDMVFGADIIAGFPTESEKAFENSLKIIDEASLTYLHVFPYSEREGTPASKIPLERQIPKNIRKERANILINKGKEKVEDLRKKVIGSRQKVIVENISIGRSEQFLDIPLSAGDYKIGELREVFYAPHQPI
ncbi:MAG: tRNA (N(6)-L-threonylcarbamoyladenosine(37)-C(2))-methylthiotransferase MtaB [Alphaproteobacteria bacterium]|jgi:threonylcarbamoyladenosine tRNA methylthiotransferase MtaB